MENLRNSGNPSLNIKVEPLSTFMLNTSRSHNLLNFIYACKGSQIHVQLTYVSKVIYEMFHILNCGFEIKYHSLLDNLCSLFNNLCKIYKTVEILNTSRSYKLLYFIYPINVALYSFFGAQGIGTNGASTQVLMTSLNGL